MHISTTLPHTQIRWALTSGIGRFFCVPILLLLFMGWLLPAIAAAEPVAYVANRGADTLSVIDVGGGSLSETLTVSSEPLDQDVRWVDVRPDGSAVYVTGDANVFVIDPDNGTVTATIPTAGPSRDVAVHPGGSLVYVADANLSVIETAGHTVDETIPIAGTPYSMTLNPYGTELYVATVGGMVEVLDVTSLDIVASIDVGGSPKMVAFAPDGQTAYVTNTSDEEGQVTVVNSVTHEIVTRITIGGSPYGVAISPDGTEAYAAEGLDGIAVIDTSAHSVTGTIPVMAIDVAFTPDGSHAVATQWETGEVMLIDTASQQVTATQESIGAWGIGMAPPDGVDLAIRMTKLKRKVKDAGDQVVVKVEICNGGNVAADGPFDVGMFMTTDGAVVPGATPDDVFTMDGLAPGECQKTVKKERKFKVKGQPDTVGRVVVVMVDPGDAVTERNEINNQARQAISE